jgi:site-specific DNA-methyltransferase (adenine-specific)
MLEAGCGRLAPGEFKQPEGRWPANVILDEEAGALLDEQSGPLHLRGNITPTRQGKSAVNTYGRGSADDWDRLSENGFTGPSRFFYCAKASKSERGEGNNHPTVKPVKLIAYLASLILPPAHADSTDRSLLVPFCGSGSELLGAREAGWDLAVGIDSNPAYIAIAESRLDR